MQTTFRGVFGLATGLVTVSLILTACSSDDSKPAQNNTGGTCWPTDPSCGLSSGAGKECVAFHDNAGSTVLSFRMAQLEVVRPTVLAQQFLQDAVVSKGISLNRPQCYQEGTGRFSWLMQLDTTNNRAITGGGHVQKDPTGGYCYINGEVEGFQASPVEIPIQTTMDGDVTVFSLAESIPTMTIPIFLNDDETSAIIMPLHEVLMTDGRISADGNCIGSWLGDELHPYNDCKPDRNDGQKMQWVNGAALTGYITIEEAEKVWIPEMTQTLCVALSGSAGTYGEDFEEGDHKGKRCKRDADGKILAAEHADWCSSTNAICAPPEADAFRLEGNFAASAVQILDTCP